MSLVAKNTYTASLSLVTAETPQVLQQLPQQCGHEGPAVSQVLQVPDSNRKTAHTLLLQHSSDWERKCIILFAQYHQTAKLRQGQTLERSGLEWCLLSRTIPFSMGWGEVSRLEGLLPCIAALVFSGPGESGRLWKKKSKEILQWMWSNYVSHLPPMAL